MSFAKLFETTKGQCLVEKIEEYEGEYAYCLRIKLEIDTPIDGAVATVTATKKYGDTDAGEIRRDTAFDMFDEVEAQITANKGMHQ